MATCIDPEDPGFIDTARLPSGRYSGRTLLDIGSTLDGLLYLQTIVTAETPPDFIRKTVLLLWIRSFLSRPDRQAVLLSSWYRRKK